MLSEETATVSYLEGEYAFLETKSTSACGTCSAQSTCGSLSFFKKKVSHLRVKNTLNLNAGDSVLLGMQSEKLLFGSVLIYIVPIFSLFTFAGLGRVWGGEGLSILMGVVGLFLALLFVKHFVAQSRISKQFEPILIRKVIGIQAIS